MSKQYQFLVSLLGTFSRMHGCEAGTTAELFRAPTELLGVFAYVALRSKQRRVWLRRLNYITGWGKKVTMKELRAAVAANFQTPESTKRFWEYMETVFKNYFYCDKEIGIVFATGLASDSYADIKAYVDYRRAHPELP